VAGGSVKTGNVIEIGFPDPSALAAAIAAAAVMGARARGADDYSNWSKVGVDSISYHPPDGGQT